MTNHSPDQYATHYDKQDDSTSNIESFIGDLSDEAEYARTRDALAFVSAIDAAGLTLSHWTLDELKNEKDRWHGNAYAWMTRAVASWIAKEKQGIGITLFEQKYPEWSDEANDYVAPPKEDFSNLIATGSIGADLLIDLIKQTATAKETGNTTSDIVVSSRTQDLKHANCKDVEAYYAKVANDFDSRYPLHTISINNKQFWHKTYGEHTFINLEDIQYRGVILPPGCVFRQEADEGYLFLRVTALAFDQEDAKDIFGSSVTNLCSSREGSDEVSNLFEKFQIARSSTASH